MRKRIDPREKTLMIAETPFESIEGALEYVEYLIEASREAREHIEKEIEGANTSELARKKEALQLVHYKLASLEFHISKADRLLNDLRKLRRLILEGREHQNTTVST